MFKQIKLSLNGLFLATRINFSQQLRSLTWLNSFKTKCVWTADIINFASMQPLLFSVRCCHANGYQKQTIRWNGALTDGSCLVTTFGHWFITSGWASIPLRRSPKRKLPIDGLYHRPALYLISRSPLWDDGPKVLPWRRSNLSWCCAPYNSQK